MYELDEVWSKKLEEAIRRAEAGGRRDIAEYLTLKATNDAVRQTAVQWLFGALLEIAAAHPQIVTENVNPHRFALSGATMVGSAIRLRHGVRCLTVEAGWTRTPTDGFMRGGALAAARIAHFGMAKENAELFLLAREANAPNWFAAAPNGARRPFHSIDLNHHFEIFLS